MWFYIYLLTTSFYEQMGFHMWGHTTNVDFSYNLTNQYSFYNNTLYYSGVYQIPTKFITFPFDRIITPPYHKIVHDQFGLEWYSMSPQTIKDICLNSFIPFNIKSLQHDEL